MKIFRLDLALLIVFGLFGLGFYFHSHDQVFQAENLHLSFSKSQAKTSSQLKLAEFGYSVEGAKSSTKFWSFSSALIYFEKKVGPQKTHELLAHQSLPIWGWETRFFWVGKPTEYQMWWSPQGDFIGFRKTLFKEEKIPSIEPAQAKKKAQEIFQKVFPDLIYNYDLTEQSSEEQLHRTDYSFRWKAKESPYETSSFISATLSGNQVTWLQKEIETPESFAQAEESTQSRRSFLAKLVQRIDTLFLACILVFLLFSWRKHWIAWKPSFILAGLIAGVSFLNFLNQLPLAWHQYSTEQTWAAFWTSEILYSLLSIALSTSWILIQVSTADVWGKLAPWSQYSLKEMVEPSFFHSKEYLFATIAGCSTAGIHLGFVSLFYLLGQKYFHFYSPLEIPYDDLLSTKLPMFAALLIGLQPAISEECVYRLFAIPFLTHFLKKRWVAICLSSLLWGFLHTSYYVEPIYVRGLELSIIGVLFALVYIRFGIWATILSHCIYNTVLSSSLLLHSSQSSLRYGAFFVVLVVLIPFFHSIYLTVMRGVTKKRLGSINFKKLEWPPHTQTEISSDRRVRKEPKSLKIKIPVIFALLSFGMICVRYSFFPTEKPWATRLEAIQMAKVTLGSFGYDFEDSYVTTLLDSIEVDPLTQKYVKNHPPKPEIQETLDQSFSKKMLWKVNFISKTDIDRCDVWLYTNLTLQSFSCRLPEDLVGGLPHLKESQFIAERFLSKQQIKLSKLKYVSGEEHALKNRRDSSHKWIDTENSYEGFRREFSVQLAGKKIIGFDVAYELPDEFRRESAKRNLYDVGKGMAWVFLGLFISFLFFRSLFDRTVIASFYSSVALKIAIATAMLFTLEAFNSTFFSFWGGFRTSTSAELYILNKYLMIAGKIVGGSIFAYVITLLFLRLPPQLFNEAPTSPDMAIIIKRPPWRWRQSRSMFYWGLGLALFFFCIETLIEPKFPIESFNTAFPWLRPSLQLWTAFLFWMASAVWISACFKYLKKEFSILLFILLLLGSSFLASDSAQSFFIHFLFRTSVLFLIVGVIQFRIPFYFWFSLFSLFLPFVNSFILGTGFYQIQSFMALSIVLICSLYVFVPWPKKP